MDNSWFDTYIKEFERRVVLAGIRAGILGGTYEVSVRRNRLERKSFGVQMGTAVETDIICVVNYYGFEKKSRGFQERVQEIRKALTDRQLKALDVPVVHFAGVRLEEVAKLAPDLVADFARFKKQVLDLRGYNHNYKP